MKLKSLLKLEYRVRWRAIAAIAAPQSEKRIAAVTARLSHPIPRVRKHAANALKILSDERSAEALIGTLEDHNIEVVMAALSALSSLRIPALLAPMSSCLWHPEPRVRRCAVREIGNTRLKEAIPRLLSAIYDEEDGTVYAALFELTINSGIKELEVSDADMQRLLELLQHNDPNTRKCTANVLSHLPRLPVVPQLFEAASDPVPAVRRNMVAALQRIPGDRGLFAVIEMLNDPVEEVRAQAAIEIGNRRDLRGIEPMLNALSRHLAKSNLRNNAASDLGWSAAWSIGYMQIWGDLSEKVMRSRGLSPAEKARTLEAMYRVKGQKYKSSDMVKDATSLTMPVETYCSSLINGDDAELAALAAETLDAYRGMKSLLRPANSPTDLLRATSADSTQNSEQLLRANVDPTITQ